MHDDGVGVRSRLLDPKRLESRKFFTGRLAGIDRKSARRQAVDFALRYSPEVACAQKDANLVVVIRLVDGGMEPKAGGAQIGTGLRRRGAAKRKKLRLISNPGRLAGRDLVDVHAVGKEKSAMEELNLERQLFAAPQRMVRGKSNGPVVVVVQIFEGIRQFVVRRLE